MPTPLNYRRYKQLRAACGLSDKELARRVAANPRSANSYAATVSVESAERLLRRMTWDWDVQDETLERLARALGCKPADLSLPGSAEIDLVHFPAEPSAADVRGREAELDRLTAAAREKQGGVVVVMGPWGQGKTALVRFWLARAAPRFFGATRVLGWSFAGQGRAVAAGEVPDTGTSDAFFRRACEVFGLRIRSPVGAGRRVARAVADGRHLLILDGLEVFQYPPGHPQAGRFTDNEIGELLGWLAANDHDTLCLATTRTTPTSLTGAAGRSAVLVALPPVSPATAHQVLADRLSGAAPVGFDPDRVIDWAAGNPLLLVTAAEQGRLGLAVAPSSASETPAIGTALDRWAAILHDSPALQLLRLFSLVDRPAALDFLRHVFVVRPVAELNDQLARLTDAGWRQAADDLRSCRLLCETEDGWDVAHPCIRSWAAAGLAEALRAEGHRRLFDYYCRTAAITDPAERDELWYRAAFHGCDAGDPATAFDRAVWEGLNDGAELRRVNDIGVSRRDVVLAGRYFEGGVFDPTALLPAVNTGERVARLLPWAAQVLMYQGHLEEANRLIEHALTTTRGWTRIVRRGRVLGTAAMIALLGGRLSRVVELAHEAQRLARLRPDRPWYRGVFVAVEGMALHEQGRLNEALKLYRSALAARPRRDGGDMVSFYDKFDLHYARACAEAGDVGTVEELARQADTDRPGGRLTRTLALGAARLGQARSGNQKLAEEAANLLAEAVEEMEVAGVAHMWCEALLYKAEADLLLGRRDAAWEFLRQADGLVRGRFPLRAIDCRLFEARLLFNQGQKDEAALAAAEAQTSAARFGYGRLTPSLAVVEHLTTAREREALPPLPGGRGS
jgi:tetratricopeptide (TPR) repeat protein